MTIDTDKLRAISQKAIQRPWLSEFSHAATPQTILSILDELDRLRAAIKLQASSAIMGMNAAKEVDHQMVEHAKKLHAEINPEAIESERSANAFLTEENERLQAEVKAAHLAGYRLAQEQAAKVQWSIYFEWSHERNHEKVAAAIRALQPPAEWGE